MAENHSPETILHEALELLDPQARKAFLDEACGDDRTLRHEVDSLLAAHHAAADTFMGTLADSPWEEATTEKEGDTIGRYKLLQEIGEGGGGTVYMADQIEPVKRRVALKVIKLGMDTRQVVARFEAERQALALMDHPNIAKVLDAGATASGRPYFVMELVKGVPITKFCDENKLSTKERLELFIQVCEAVQHAHQKGIIHRDLKPGNILVTMMEDRPLPKVIDFGIAKATQQELTEKTLFTQHGHIIGTPAYMSPEQASLTGYDIDTRSDIYALGVVLYELLCGQTPFDTTALLKAGYDEIRRVIAEDEPSKPSTRLSSLGGGELTTLATHRHTGPKRLSKLMRGDLDWVVMKALEKDRRRRYETANGFAMDVRRFLDQEPVIAGPPGMGYKMGKFVRRNRTAVSVVATISFLLVAGIFGTSWFAVSSQRANKALAVKMAEEAEAALIKFRYEEAKTWLERARLKKSEKNDFAAAMMAAKALGFRGFGAEQQPPEFRKKHPVLLDKEQPEFKELMRIAMSAGGSSWPLWQSPISSDAGQPILCVAFSPDGTAMASGGEDATIRLWKVSTGKEIQSLQGHQSPVTSVSFSPDGTTLASGSEDKTVRLWDAATGKEIRILQGHQQGLSSVAFSPDGATLASGSGDSTITLWNVSTGIEIQSLEGHEQGVTSVSFSPDGATLASGSEDKTLKVWNVATGEETHSLEGHEDPVTSVAFNPNGVSVASGSGDSTIKLWMLSTGNEIRSFRGHGGGVRSVAFSPDGTALAGGSGDATTTLWNVSSGRLIQSLRAHRGFVHAVAFSPDGSSLASGSEDKTIKLWKISTGKEMRSLEGHEQGVTSVSFSPNGNTLASGSEDHTIKLWNIATGKEIQSLEGHEGPVTSLSFSPNGATLASGSGDKTIKLWDLSTGQAIQFLDAHRGGVCSVAFSLDGTVVASGSKDKTIKLWSVSTGKEIRTPLRGHRALVTSVAFSPHGRTLASGSADSTIKLWNPSTGGGIKSLQGHGSAVQSVAFSPDDAILASGSADRTIKLWNADTGIEIRSLHWHGDMVLSVAFSPDGATLASGSEDKTVKLWNVSTGREIQSLEAHQEGVSSVAFSPDGTLLVSGSEDKTIKLWVVRHSPLDLARYLDTRNPWCQLDGSQIVWTTGPDRETQVMELADAAKHSFEHGRNDEAMRDLNEALSLIGKDGKNARNRVLLLSLETLALQVLAEQLGHDPGRELVWQNLASKLETIASTVDPDPADETRKACGILANVIWTASARNRDAAAAARVRRVLQAVPDMPEILKSLHPDNPLELNGAQLSIPAPLRVELLRQQGEREQALRLIERQLAVAAHAFYHTAGAEILEELGRAEESAVAFAHAIALMQDHDELPPAFLIMKNAALLMWFGKEADHAAMSKRILTAAADTKVASIAAAVAEAICLGPINEAAVKADALTLARRALKLKAYVWYDLGLGIAEYRSGNYPAAEQALSKAVEGAQRERESFRARIMGMASYYRVMSLFKRDREAEARELFMGTQATMKPLPFFEQHPLAGGADHDDLILWLAYREAAGLLGILEQKRAGPLITFQQGVNSGFGVYESAHNVGVRGNVPDTKGPVGRMIARDHTHPLIRFGDLFGKGPGAIPPGAHINSATLRLHVFNPGPRPSIHQMAAAWDPESITHDNALLNGNVLPGIQADNLEAWATPAGKLPHGNTGEIDIDVTSSVQNWSNGAGNFGWVLLGAHSPNAWAAQGNEVDRPSDRPKLIVEYESPSEKK